jgi:hypothetical protein
VVVIRLTQSQLDDATELARATHAKWGARRGYYPNKFETHLKGKMGEVAVETWAVGLGRKVDSAFRDLTREREADIVIDGQRVEVKTWDFTGWQEWGRCVRPPQLPQLRAKADAVVWCYLENAVVTIVGWSTLKDIEQVEVTVTGPTYNRLENHQVPLDEVRDLGGLLTTL